MNNPFEIIDSRLSNIENLLLDIKHQPKDTVANQESDSLLTVEDAANFLHLSVPTIYTKISKGELPVIKNNGSKRCYFLKSDLITYLKSGRAKTVKKIEGSDDLENSEEKSKKKLLASK